MNCFSCSKNIKNTIICSNCESKFCSESCLSFHSYFYHNGNNNSNIKNDIIDKYKNSSNNKKKSPYIVQGYLYQKIKYDSIYSLKNFIPVHVNEKPKLIGYGSFGKVFLGQNIINKKYYAIKHMEKKSIYKALHSLDTIYTEIKIQSIISHPNIVNILFVNETDKHFDLVLEYATKGNLFFYIQKNRYLSESKSFQFFILILNAIYFLHKNNYIHRDIKPENILLFDNNIVKLCDFGWCVKLEGDKPRTTYCGTTEYMAPEMINERVYGKEIDNWALGILLYEMLHGYSPFKPHKPVFHDKDVIDNIRYQKNIMFNSQLSDECIELINHLLEKNIEKRYNTEDIFNSKFVKNFQKLKYFFPNKNKIEKEKNDNIKIVSNKTARNFYPKSIEDSRQKEIIETYSSECNSNIDENEIQRKNNYIKQNSIINNSIKEPKRKEISEIENNKTSKIEKKFNEILNKREENQSNFIYISTNKNKILEINNQEPINNNLEEKDSKIIRNKSLSQLKYKTSNYKLKFINNEEEEEENENENKNEKRSFHNNYNFNNINIILCNNNLNKDLSVSQINNNITFQNDNQNSYISKINNNTINSTRTKSNNCLPKSLEKNNLTNFVKKRNSPRNLMNEQIKIYGESNNLMVKRIKIFNPKNSNIMEINSKSKNKTPIIIKELKIPKNDNSVKIKNIINYFVLYKNIVKKDNRKRNSFPFFGNSFIKKDNNKINKYRTIENIKNNNINQKMNKLKKKNKKKFIEANNSYHYQTKFDNNINKFLEYNKLEETTNKDISKNKLCTDELNKTPKKIEDNIQINPQILLDNLRKELFSINKKNNLNIK